ncbi:hypothetical protein JHK86_031149 [Glycine max]|nr:hypothetical protein JHK86_031149 [Glycine max]
MSSAAVALIIMENLRGFELEKERRGHIERRYIEVSHGASWAEVTMITSGFDTTRRFYVDVVKVIHA